MPDYYDDDRYYTYRSRPSRSRSVDIQDDSEAVYYTYRDGQRRPIRRVYYDRDDAYYYSSSRNDVRDYNPSRRARAEEQMALVLRDEDVDRERRDTTRALVVADKTERVSVDESDSDGGRNDDRRRRRRRRRDRDNNDDNDNNNNNDSRSQSAKPSGGGARCWYSQEDRKKAPFHHRHFDSSYDGIIAAVAGGALGAMTAGRFGGEKHRKAKIVGGALAGAVVFNAGENWYRVYTEEEEEDKEKGREEREDLRERQQQKQQQQ